MTELPQRKKLPHGIPSWVEDGSIYFITMCGCPRGENQFCRRNTAPFLLESAALYNERQTWFARLFLLMPDHIHALISFPRDKPMRQIISSWKGYHARKLGIRWQRDFFDHRLRNDESETEKAQYIRQNPVRAGLVQKPEDWPHVWTPW